MANSIGFETRVDLTHMREYEASVMLAGVVLLTRTYSPYTTSREDAERMVLNEFAYQLASSLED